MSLLKKIPPEQVPDEVKLLYEEFLRSPGMIPPPFDLLSVSPGLQTLQAGLIGYYRQGSRISALLQALIRYLAAVAMDIPQCVRFNEKVLALHGMPEDRIRDLRTNPAAAPLEEKEGWLLALVIKAVRAPETLTGDHVEKLRDLGWTDADILDALYLACMMVGMGVMMKALKAEE